VPENATATATALALVLVVALLPDAVAAVVSASTFVLLELLSAD
jgi:hypothetical protein